MTTEQLEARITELENWVQFLTGFSVTLAAALHDQRKASLNGVLAGEQFQVDENNLPPVFEPGSLVDLLVSYPAAETGIDAATRYLWTREFPERLVGRGRS